MLIGIIHVENFAPPQNARHVVIQARGHLRFCRSQCCSLIHLLAIWHTALVPQCTLRSRVLFLYPVPCNLPYRSCNPVPCSLAYCSCTSTLHSTYCSCTQYPETGIMFLYPACCNLTYSTCSQYLAIWHTILCSQYCAVWHTVLVASTLKFEILFLCPVACNLEYCSCIQYHAVRHTATVSSTL